MNIHIPPDSGQARAKAQERPQFQLLLIALYLKTRSIYRSVLHTQ